MLQQKSLQAGERTHIPDCNSIRFNRSHLCSCDAPRHTPGPWYQNGKSIRSLFGNEDHHLIADVSGLHSDEAEFAANANLIAAAPDLLKACKTLRAIVHAQVACVDSKFDRGMTSANTAIAKAEGRE